MPATQRKTWTPEEEHQFLLEIEQFKASGITKALKTVAPRYGLSFSAASSRYYSLRQKMNGTTPAVNDNSAAGQNQFNNLQANTPTTAANTANKTNKTAVSNAYDYTEALNRAYKLLITRSRRTKDGRLDYKEIEAVSNMVGLPYAKVLSLWGTANQAGFWAVTEVRKLQERIQSLEVERDLCKKELRERAEAFDRYYRRSEKVKAALRERLGNAVKENQTNKAKVKRFAKSLIAVTAELPFEMIEA